MWHFDHIYRIIKLTKITLSCFHRRLHKKNSFFQHLNPQSHTSLFWHTHTLNQSLQCEINFVRKLQMITQLVWITYEKIQTIDHLNFEMS